FSGGATLLSTLLFGTLPAIRAAKADPLPAIHGSPSGKPRRRALVSSAIVAGQLALSLALVFSTGLFVQTLRNLRAIDLGFRPENLITLIPSLAGTVHEAPVQRMQFFQQLQRRIADWPETRAVSMAGGGPAFSGNFGA